MPDLVTPEFIKTAENVAVFDPKSESAYVYSGYEPQLVDWADLDRIRSKGGRVVNSQEALEISEKTNKPVTTDDIETYDKLKQELSSLQDTKDYWKRTKQLALSVKDESPESYKKISWLSRGLGWNEERNVFEMGLALVMPVFEYIPKITIAVPQVGNFERYFKIANKEIYDVGYLNELMPEKVFSALKDGTKLVYPSQLRNTFDTFGVITEKTLRWQAKLEYEKFEVKFLLQRLINRLQES